MKLNMAGVANAGELLPEGQYNFTVVTAELQDKPAGPYLSLKFKVSEGEEHAGRIIFDGGSTAIDSLPFLKKVLEGVTGVAWDSENMELDPSDLPGLQFDAIVVHKPRNDQPNVLQPKIGTYLAEIAR